MRRVLSAIVLLALLGAVLWTLFTWRQRSSTAADPWQAIPTQSAAIVVLPNAVATWDKATQTAQLWRSLEQLPAAAATGRVMSSLHARMEQDAALREALHGRDALLALLRAGGDGMGWLLVLAPAPGSMIPTDALGEVLGADAATTQALRNGKVVVVQPDTALPALSFCIREGLCLLASSSAVLDEALLQLGSAANITQEPALAEALSTLGGGSDAHLLVHATRGQGLLHTWWDPEAVERWELPDGWAALDVRVRPDALLLSGLFFPSAEDATLKAMAAQGSGDHALGRVLPASVSMMEVQHISDAAQWSQDRATEGGSDEALAVALFSWVDGPIGLATAPANNGMPAMRWGLFTTSDSAQAVEALTSLCTEGCDTLRYRDQRLTRLPRSSAHERVLGKPFDRLERPWWTVLGDVVLFSDDPLALQASIDAWNDGRSLAEDDRTSTWRSRMSASAGRSYWCDVARSRSLYQDHLRSAKADSTVSTDSLWNSLGGLSVQIAPGQRGHFHLTVGLQHAPLAAPTSGTLWSTELGAQVQGMPQLLRNHVNNSNEVLVQDVRNRIHLLGSSGKVLWTRQLDGPLLGGVHQVDRFRNGKLQMLFNTARSVYLVDRNGKDVGGFPIALKHDATAPLAVFDYDNERDYRVLVMSADARVLNFGLDGQVVKGWEAPKLAAAGTNSPRHLRIRNKDYLLVIDGQGNTLLLDRRGTQREKTSLELGAGAVLRALVPGSDVLESELTWHTPEGALMHGTLAGTPTTLMPVQAGGWHPLDTGQEEGLYVRVHVDSVVVQQNGNIRFARTFGNTVQAPAQGHALGDGQYVLSAVVPGSEQVHLLDTKGYPVAGSPFLGAVPALIADLDGDGRLELITATSSGTVLAHRIDGKPLQNQ